MTSLDQELRQQMSADTASDQVVYNKLWRQKPSLVQMGPGRCHVGDDSRQVRKRLQLEGQIKAQSAVLKGDQFRSQ